MEDEYTGKLLPHSNLNTLEGLILAKAQKETCCNVDVIQILNYYS